MSLHSSARPCVFVRTPSSPGGGSLGRRCWLIGTGVEDKQQMVPLGKDGTQCGKCSLPGHGEPRQRGEGSRHPHPHPQLHPRRRVETQHAIVQSHGG